MNNALRIVACLLLVVLLGCSTDRSSLRIEGWNGAFGGSGVHTAVLQRDYHFLQDTARQLDVNKIWLNSSYSLGWTPLELACGIRLPSLDKNYQGECYYDPRAAMILLERGANPHARPGMPSPLELARRNSKGRPEDEALINALIARGGDKESP